ncbi:MAG TPA: substrate-binding domain-containing protein [Terracidiphilus sp.]|nr:substrate-binding domain-containing protein [Terracidiphilus sp.]
MLPFPRIALFTAAILPALAAQAQPGYVPEGRTAGIIRVWGSVQMQELMRLWEAGFHRYQPEVRFEERLNGTVSAMGGLYAGAADLALMGREIWPEETMAYTQVTGAAPTGVEVAMGSFDVPTKADALMVFVARGNPLTKISFDQLGVLFGCRKQGPPTWSQAGVTGEMGKQPVHVYGYLPANAAARFFQNRVLRGAPWNCGLHAFGNRQTKAGGRIDAGRQIVDALAADPLGIAIANIHYTTPSVKALALSEGTGLPFIAPDRSDYAAGRYPLTRSVFIYFDCGNRKGECSPAVREFLRYVLSREGQQDVSREGAYFPLPSAVLARERSKLPSVK